MTIEIYKAFAAQGLTGYTIEKRGETVLVLIDNETRDFIILDFDNSKITTKMSRKTREKMMDMAVIVLELYNENLKEWH